MSELFEKMTQAFVDLFAMNVPDRYLGIDEPGYYRIHLDNVAPNGSAVDLVLTFLSGKRYCCYEFACHFPYYAEYGWARLRECMNRNGLDQFPLPVIRTIRVVIDQGAVAIPTPNGPAYIDEGSGYQIGPFEPLLPNGK